MYGSTQSTSGDWALNDVSNAKAILTPTIDSNGRTTTPANENRSKSHKDSKKRRKRSSGAADPDEAGDDNDGDEDDKNALAVYPWMTRVHSSTGWLIVYFLKLAVRLADKKLLGSHLMMNCYINL